MSDIADRVKNLDTLLMPAFLDFYKSMRRAGFSRDDIADALTSILALLSSERTVDPIDIAEAFIAMVHLYQIGGRKTVENFHRKSEPESNEKLN